MSQASTDPAPAPRGSIAQLYRATLKRQDIAFNVYVCRPLAAVVVYWLQGTRVTPNQVTFFSLLVCGLAVLCFVAVPWPLGLWLGALVYELSYVFDKVDGMLARSRGVVSASGHLLDFLMDEIKAFSILAAVATGAYLSTGRAALLLVGLVGVVCLASGIGMTTFTRRPEVLAARHATADAVEPVTLRPPRRAVRAAEAVGRFFIHYPSYIWLAALLGDARFYLYPYVAVNALYAARSLLGLVLRYGRFS
jgi:phosphatidylglycerophosphate synthase